MAVETKKTESKTKKAAPKKVSKASSLSSEQKGEFAVIATGGKQYVVSAGSTIKIEKLSGEYKAGDKLTFDKVLIVDNGTDTTVGTPYISGAKVTGELVESGRNKKVETIKYKQKSRYFIRRGHRQPFFLVKIDSIK